MARRVPSTTGASDSLISIAKVDVVTVVAKFPDAIAPSVAVNTPAKVLGVLSSVRAVLELGFGIGITENIANFDNTPDIGVNLSVARILFR